VEGSFEHCNEPSGSVQNEEISYLSERILDTQGLRSLKLHELHNVDKLLRAVIRKKDE
jgi:hypothetical protein